ncbi:MAG: hypothetical protein J1E56_01500 [Ruminococcus sp.]|nr:hypothetical protein [Ruminococcus sp.]
MKAFSNFHPVVIFIYFIAVFSVSMFIQNPVYLITSLTGAFLFLCVLNTIKISIISILKYIPFTILITLLNPLFSHSGATPLFFINDNAFTLEALIYGAVLALMILCVIFWFKSFNIIFNSEKILFLFGKISPKISLIFSMALHFIPNFSRYFNEVLSVQKKLQPKSKLKIYISCFSAVITHSLETSVDTSDSMSARGHSTGRVTNFGRFRFKTNDFILLISVIILTLLTYIAIVMGTTKIVYYPVIIFSNSDISSLISYVAFTILCFLPGIYEIKEDLKWKHLISRI